MNLTDLKNKIRNWLVASSELPDEQVIFDFQNAPKPTQDFITLNPFKNIGTKGMAETIDSHDGTVTVIQNKFSDMSINCYGSDTENIMSKIKDSLDLPLTKEYFEREVISVLTDSSIRDLTFIEGVKFQIRKQLDITVLFSNSTIQEVGYFDTIEVSSNDLNPDYSIETSDILNLDISLEKSSSKIDSSVTDIELNLIKETQGNNDYQEVIDTSISFGTVNTVENFAVNETEISIFSNPLIINKNKVVDLNIKFNHNMSYDGIVSVPDPAPEIPIEELLIFNHLFSQDFTDSSSNHLDYSEDLSDDLEALIFEHQFVDLNDNSISNENNWLISDKSSLDESIFQHRFIDLTDTDQDNNYTENNDTQIEISPIFNHLFINLLDDTTNSNDYSEVTG